MGLVLNIQIKLEECSSFDIFFMQPPPSISSVNYLGKYIDYFFP